MPLLQVAIVSQDSQEPPSSHTAEAKKIAQENGGIADSDSSGLLLVENSQSFGSQPSAHYYKSEPLD